MKHAFPFCLTLTLLIGLYCAGCATEQKISYQRDLHPIFADKCMNCHTPPYGEGYRKSGLDMESYETLMEGSIYGPVVIPGDSRKSPLNILVEGRAGNLSRALEARHQPMTDDEIKALQWWVEQGAKNN